MKLPVFSFFLVLWPGFLAAAQETPPTVTPEKEAIITYGTGCPITAPVGR